MIDWNFEPFLNTLATETVKILKDIYHAVGLGGGAGALQLLRFMPPPWENQTGRGMIMDTLWTLAGQQRAGERRRREDGAWIKPDGTVVKPGPNKKDSLAHDPLVHLSDQPRRPAMGGESDAK